MLSGLPGVGGRFVMVPALRRYTDLAMQSVVATSLAVIALVPMPVVVSSSAAGTLNWSVALLFTLAPEAFGRPHAFRFAHARPDVVDCKVHHFTGSKDNDRPEAALLAEKPTGCFKTAIRQKALRKADS